MNFAIFLVPKPSVNISQIVDSPNIEQNHNLTCTVTVVNGTSSSLVVINWSGRDLSIESSRVTISDQTNNGLQHTRIITFSPILSEDRDQYTCSVSVTGFREANNSDSVMVMVSGKYVLGETVFFPMFLENFVWAGQRVKVCCIFHKVLFMCEECFIY